MYKPLPDSVTIKESPISGLGLFATEKISKGTMLGMIHHPRKGHPDDPYRTPFGGFGNHSDNPSCDKLMMQEDGTNWVFANQDIEPGTEVTWRYTLYTVIKRKEDLTNTQ